MTTKGAILKTIRAYCLDCCSGSSKEVDECKVGQNITSTPGRCALYPFRHGTDPNPSRKGFAGKTPRVAEGIDEQKRDKSDMRWSPVETSIKV